MSIICCAAPLLSIKEKLQASSQVFMERYTKKEKNIRECQHLKKEVL